MSKRLYTFLIILFFMPVIVVAKEEIVLGKKIIPAPLEKKPISVRAAEARKKKVFDYKQHYMKSKQNGTLAGSGFSSTATGEVKTIKPRIAVARFGDVKNINNNPFSALIADMSLDRTTNTIITKNKDTEPYDGFTEDIITALMETDKFIVVERKDITKILREQGFQATGFVENVTDKAFSAITGIDYIINGSLGSYEEGKRIVNLRVYDVFLGTIVASKRITADSKWDAIKMAVDSIAEKVKPKEWKLKVSNVNGASLYLNGGAAEGLKSGQKCEIFSTGNKIYDPDTNELIATEEMRVALVKIGSVNTHYATATVIEQSKPIKIGDIVRLYQGVFFDGEAMNESGFLKAEKVAPVSQAPVLVNTSGDAISNTTQVSMPQTTDVSANKTDILSGVKKATEIAGQTISTIQQVGTATTSASLDKASTVVETISSVLANK